MITAHQVPLLDRTVGNSSALQGVVALRLRLFMADALDASASGPLFALRSVRALACERQRIAVAAATNVTLSLSPATTPIITAVSPPRGSSAGGTTLTLTVDGLGNDTAATDLTVTIAGVACAVLSVAPAAVCGQLVCVTGAHGPTSVRPGVGGPALTTPMGTAAAVESAVFADLWSSHTTWGGGIPPPVEGDSVWIQKGQSLLLDVSPPRLYMIIVQALEFDRIDLNLDAHIIFVVGGSLTVGTEQEPFLQKAVITLHGSPVSKELPQYGAKVIACRVCTLDLHGKPTLRTWTNLAATATAGSKLLYLQEPVDWIDDSMIALRSTAVNGSLEEAETLVIDEVFDGGTTLRLASPLLYTHLGEVRPLAGGHSVEFRVNVALLSQNVVIQGTSPFSQLDRYGGHVMLHSAGHESLVGRIEDIELRYVGQGCRLGRYPLHLHMVRRLCVVASLFCLVASLFCVPSQIGTVRNSYIKRTSIQHTFNRREVVVLHSIALLLPSRSA